MSGHSKWHNIQARKGKQDAKRSNLFSMYSKKISVTAQAGGDPTTNFALRILVDKARDIGMPKDNIERAIKRGTGEDKSGAKIEECMYECYGPSGVAIIANVVTDNKNRTVAELKHALSKFGGSIGGAGSVAWMFEQWGMVQFQISDLGFKIDDEFELTMIEAGAEDITKEENEIFIKTKVENLQTAIGKLKELGVEELESGLVWIAKDEVPIEPEVKEKLEKLFALLDENEDIDEFFTNAGE